MGWGRSRRKIGPVRGLMGGCRPLVMGGQARRGTGETGTWLLAWRGRALNERSSNNRVVTRGYAVAWDWPSRVHVREHDSPAFVGVVDPPLAPRSMDALLLPRRFLQLEFDVAEDEAARPGGGGGGGW